MSVGALSRETNSLRTTTLGHAPGGRESLVRARDASSAAHTRAVPDHRPARIGEVSRGAPMDGHGGAGAGACREITDNIVYQMPGTSG
jgi:hypothetical protein